MLCNKLNNQSYSFLENLLSLSFRNFPEVLGLRSYIAQNKRSNRKFQQFIRMNVIQTTNCFWNYFKYDFKIKLRSLFILESFIYLKIFHTLACDGQSSLPNLKEKNRILTYYPFPIFWSIHWEEFLEKGALSKSFS